MQNSHANRPLKIIFLLPAGGGGGGAHCIVHEALEMRRLGVDAQIAVEERYRTNYRSNYPSLEGWERLFYFYESLDPLLDHISDFHVAVGTIYHSMQIVGKIVDRHPNILPAYYVQDYEPWFFETGSKEHKTALDSYTLVPNAVIFAKTNWLCDVVEKNHDVTVHKVACPSFVQQIFYPLFGTGGSEAPVRAAAMIRPRTPRRAAARTMRVLKQVKQTFGEGVEVHLFGCTEGEFHVHGLTRGFSYINHGVLLHESVADVLRCSDIFLDLSDWQAFGLTGLEAMACGCALVLPLKGGAGEYADEEKNAIMVDTQDEGACIDAVTRLVEDDHLLRAYRLHGLQRAPLFSTYRTVISVLSIVGSSLEGFDRRAHRSVVKVHHLKTFQGIDLSKYDFLDFGASMGGSLNFAKKYFGGTRGLGIDKDPKKVQMMVESGQECIEGDIARLDFPANAVRFVTMLHILEHLPDLQSIEKAIASAARVATDFLVIFGPYFDADDYLRQLGLKLYWSDWTGHPYHLKSLELKRILESLGLLDYRLFVRVPIIDSSDPVVHPLHSPKDQHSYDASLHPPKKVVRFSQKIYQELICYVSLKDDIKNWENILCARADALPLQVT